MATNLEEEKLRIQTYSSLISDLESYSYSARTELLGNFVYHRYMNMIMWYAILSGFHDDLCPMHMWILLGRYTLYSYGPYPLISQLPSPHSSSIGSTRRTHFFSPREWQRTKRIMHKNILFVRCHSLGEKKWVLRVEPTEEEWGDGSWPIRG